MPTTVLTNMGELELSETDEHILDMLQEGRCSPAYIADELQLSRQHITNRLRRFEEHDVVEKIHRGLYELVNDPRERTE